MRCDSRIRNCLKLLFVYVLCTADETSADSEECTGSSPPEYCRFVFAKFTECCTDDLNPDCAEVDEIFEWKNKYYVIYRRYIWPLKGFTRQGFPIFVSPAADTKDVTDPQYFPGLGNIALRGFIQSVLVYKEDIFIAVRRSIWKHAVDIYVADSIGTQVQKMNKEAGEAHDLFTQKFIDNYLIRTAVKIPMDTVAAGLQNVVVAFLSSSKKIVNLVALFNESGSLIEQKNDLKLKTCASVVYDNEPVKSKFKYILLRQDGYMCHFQREYMDNSFLLDDQKAYKGYKNCIFCWPIHVIVGCPQPFCLRTDIDDFSTTVDTESNGVVHYLYRGPYFWPFKANKLPLPFPKREDAKLIISSSPWQGSPSYIDAAFSVQNLGMEFTYIFKDDKVYKYVDLLPAKNPIPINTEFRSSDNMSFVDTAMYVPNSHTLLLFEDDYVHLFKAKFEGSQLFWIPGHPQLIAISYNLTGLPGNIDATLKMSNLTIATKENFYYTIDSANWDTAHNREVYSGQISFSIKENDGLFESHSLCSNIYKSDATEFKALLKLFKPKAAESTSRFKYESSADVPSEWFYEDDESDDDNPIKNSKYKTIFIAIGVVSIILMLIMLLILSRTFFQKGEEQTAFEPSIQESSRAADVKNKGENKTENKVVNIEPKLKQTKNKEHSKWQDSMKLKVKERVKK